MNPLESLKKLWKLLLDATKELCMRLALALCLFFGYVVLSMAAYAILRHFLVPQKTHVLPVHLMFSSSSCQGDSHQDSFVRPIGTESASLHPKCSYPFAEFYLAEGKRLLSPGQTYTIAVELDLPESPVNENIGMFMVNLTLYSYSGTPSVVSIRPTILHYKSFLLKTLSTVFYSFPLVLGLTEEKQKQVIVMLSNFQEPYTDGTVMAKVTILSNLVQVYSVELTLDAVFTGLSYYLYQWPISMAIIIISGIFFSLSTVTILMWARQCIEKMERFRYRRRHSSLRMNLRASELGPIPEEDEHRRARLAAAGNPLVGDTDNTTDTLETGSTTSSFTEVNTTSDISELDSNLQSLREQVVTVEHSAPQGGLEPQSPTPLVTDSQDDATGVRQRKT